MLIYGTVIKVQSYSTEKNKGILRINNLENNKNYSIKYGGFLPVHNLDSIKGSVDSELNFIDKPLVVPVETLDYLKQSLYASLKNLKFGHKKCSDFIDELFEYSGDINKIYKNLNLWADDKSKRNFTTTILTSVQLDKFLNWWKKNYLLRKLYLLGLTDSEIKYSYLDYNKIYERLKNNPFSLPSITVDKAININNLLENKQQKYDLVGANITRFIYKSGWTSMPISYIAKAFPEIYACLEYIKTNFPLVFEEKYVYSEYSYKVETFLAQKIKTMLLRDKNEKLLNIDLPKAINTIIKDDKITLTDEQIKALEGSLENHISVISGGAGCGKTTLIKNIIKNLEYRKVNYVLSSFTGKAVLRIKEVLGEELSKNCYTLSLLIQKKKFNNNPPKFDTIVIDEASMISGSLIYEFLSFYKHYFKIILVGDINQLPPIGICSFFKEVILSKIVPVYYLNINKRIVDNVKSSNILKNANLLLTGKLSEFTTGNGFETICGDKKIVQRIVYALYKKGVQMKDITVLTPYNKDIQEINDYARKVFFGGAENYIYNNTSYIIGDRVMQTVNVYGGEDTVMNGEEGVIKSINSDTLSVDFGNEKVIDYKWCSDKKIVKKDKEDQFAEASEKDFYSCDLKHSFCKTVHKAQGSECLYVIFYLPKATNKNSFVNINLLYTAITRSKKTFWLVYDRQTLSRALETKLKDNYDRLAIRLNEP